MRGNTSTCLAGALALVSENLRKMIKFFKKKLTQVILTPKNERLSSTFGQSDNNISGIDESDKPPG